MYEPFNLNDSKFILIFNIYNIKIKLKIKLTVSPTYFFHL